MASSGGADGEVTDSDSDIPGASHSEQEIDVSSSDESTSEPPKKKAKPKALLSRTIPVPSQPPLLSLPRHSTGVAFLEMSLLLTIERSSLDQESAC